MLVLLGWLLLLSEQALESAVDSVLYIVFLLLRLLLRLSLLVRGRLLLRLFPLEGVEHGT